MKILRCSLASLLLVLASGQGHAQIVTLPQVNNAAGYKVAATGSVPIDSTGAEKGTVSNPIVTSPTAAASSTPCTVTATTSAATPTGCTATGSAGTYIVGPFAPKPGYPVRLTTIGTWTGTITEGTSFDNCATVIPITVAGQSWGSFTNNVNEVPDFPATTMNFKYCLSISLTSGTITAYLFQ